MLDAAVSKCSVSLCILCICFPTALQGLRLGTPGPISNGSAHLLVRGAVRETLIVPMARWRLPSAAV